MTPQNIIITPNTVPDFGVIIIPWKKGGLEVIGAGEKLVTAHRLGVPSTAPTTAVPLWNGHLIQRLAMIQTAWTIPGI